MTSWRTSSFSSAHDNNCVEVAWVDADTVAVRDSKDPGGPVLRAARGDVRWLVGLRGPERG